ncbi:hypothetical protein AB0F91_46250 [Amycolatopsis sp. NPDC023774]|uniref:hypothetical protein n=1 Tax=Amycolatopsis sp. NPDC023774 TaxID=3155015 RepID=UPI0033EC3C58
MGDKRQLRIGTGGIVLGAVVVLAALGVTAAISFTAGSDSGTADAVRHFESRVFPSPSPTSAAETTSMQPFHTNHIFSANPYEAVRFVYHNIAQGFVDDACGRFSEDVQDKFAQDVGQMDCRAAVEALHEQVTSQNDYAESLPSYVSGPAPASVVTIDSCTFDIEGGPALGFFQVAQVDKGQWLITGHSPGPEKCLPH